MLRRTRFYGSITGNRYPSETRPFDGSERQPQFCIREYRPAEQTALRSAVFTPHLPSRWPCLINNQCRIRESTNDQFSNRVYGYTVQSSIASQCNTPHLHFSNFTRSERDISWRATKKNISGRSVYGAFTTARNMDEYFFTEVKPFFPTAELEIARCDLRGRNNCCGKL